jgi:hypothetical protein
VGGITWAVSLVSPCYLVGVGPEWKSESLREIADSIERMRQPAADLEKRVCATRSRACGIGRTAWAGSAPARLEFEGAFDSRLSTSRPAIPPSRLKSLTLFRGLCYGQRIVVAIIFFVETNTKEGPRVWPEAKSPFYV